VLTIVPEASYSAAARSHVSAGIAERTSSFQRCCPGTYAHTESPALTTPIQVCNRTRWNYLPNTLGMGGGGFYECQSRVKSTHHDLIRFNIKSIVWNQHFDQLDFIPLRTLLADYATIN